MQPTSITPQPDPMAPSQPPVKTTVRRKNWLLPLTLVLVLVALVVAGWMWLSAMNQQAEEETPTVSVSITDSGFTPATVKIKKGQDVTWTNQDSKAHKLVGDANSPAGFKSDEALNKGDSYTFTFEESGTYTYHDEQLIENKGTVVVE
jgi:plastocyanin